MQLETLTYSLSPRFRVQGDTASLIDFIRYLKTLGFTNTVPKVDDAVIQVTLRGISVINREIPDHWFPSFDLKDEATVKNYVQLHLDFIEAIELDKVKSIEVILNAGIFHNEYGNEVHETGTPYTLFMYNDILLIEGRVVHKSEVERVLADFESKGEASIGRLTTKTYETHTQLGCWTISKESLTSILEAFDVEKDSSAIIPG